MFYLLKPGSRSSSVHKATGWILTLPVWDGKASQERFGFMWRDPCLVNSRAEEEETDHQQSFLNNEDLLPPDCSVSDSVPCSGAHGQDVGAWAPTCDLSQLFGLLLRPQQTDVQTQEGVTNAHGAVHRGHQQGEEGQRLLPRRQGQRHLAGDCHGVESQQVGVLQRTEQPARTAERVRWLLKDAAKHSGYWSSIQTNHFFTCEVSSEQWKSRLWTSASEALWWETLQRNDVIMTSHRPGCRRSIYRYFTPVWKYY